MPKLSELEVDLSKYERKLMFFMRHHPHLTLDDAVQYVFKLGVDQLREKTTKRHLSLLLNMTVHLSTEVAIAVDYALLESDFSSRSKLIVYMLERLVETHNIDMSAPNIVPDNYYPVRMVKTVGLRLPVNLRKQLEYEANEGRFNILAIGKRPGKFLNYLTKLAINNRLWQNRYLDL